jgi:hypothetical protein
LKENLTEYEHQVKIFAWADIKSIEMPELKLLNSSLSGVRLSIGQATKAKRAGMPKGYPDIFLPVPRGEYHGLFIELKRFKPRGYPSPDQDKWLRELAAQGYAASCCRGHDAAIMVIQDYLNI